MPVFYTTMGPFGTIKVEPSRPSRAGDQVIHSKTITCRMEKAWLSDKTLAPEFVDTDKPLPGNLMSWEGAWGEDWPVKIVAWLKDRKQVKKFGFKEGDPRGQRPVTVTLTQAQLDDMKAKGFIPGGVAHPDAGSGVTKGTRTTPGGKK